MQQPIVRWAGGLRKKKCPHGSEVEDNAVRALELVQILQAPLPTMMNICASKKHAFNTAYRYWLLKLIATNFHKNIIPAIRKDQSALIGFVNWDRAAEVFQAPTGVSM